MIAQENMFTESIGILSTHFCCNMPVKLHVKHKTYLECSLGRNPILILLCVQLQKFVKRKIKTL